MIGAGVSISVYLPTRNRVGLLRRAIESVLAQTFADIELIVVDDASEDGTQELVSAYCDDPRVRYFRLDVCRGAPAARNLAISEAKGTLITGIDDDDVWTPDRLSKMVKRLAPGVSFVAASDIIELDGSKRYIARRPLAIGFDDLLRRNVVGNQVLARRSDILGCGGFDQELKASQDYDLWIRLAEARGPGIGLPEPLQIIHAQPSRNRISTSRTRLSGLRLVYRKHRGKMTRQQRKSHLFNLLRTSQRPLSLRTFRTLLTYSDRYRMAAHFLRTRFPAVDQVIENIAIWRDRSEIRSALQAIAHPEATRNTYADQ